MSGGRETTHTFDLSNNQSASFIDEMDEDDKSKLVNDLHNFS